MENFQYNTQSLIEKFADTADLGSMSRAVELGVFSGFTTNPILMRAAGVQDYEAYARKALGVVGALPVSFEVLSSEPDEIVRQAKVICGWGPNVYVKVPATLPNGDNTRLIIQTLVEQGVQLNVTGILSLGTVYHTARSLRNAPTSLISIFAGRIADIGQDPEPTVTAAAAIIGEIAPTSRLVWASAREIYNLVQAKESGADIITLPETLWPKLSTLGRDLESQSRATAQDLQQGADSVCEASHSPI